MCSLSFHLSQWGPRCEEKFHTRVTRSDRVRCRDNDPIRREPERTEVIGSLAAPRRAQAASFFIPCLAGKNAPFCIFGVDRSASLPRRPRGFLFLF